MTSQTDNRPRNGDNIFLKTPKGKETKVPQGSGYSSPSSPKSTSKNIFTFRHVYTPFLVVAHSIQIVAGDFAIKK